MTKCKSLSSSIILFGALASFGLISGAQARRSFGSIQGVVLDDRGKPLSNATVLALPEEDMLHPISGKCDDAGRYTIYNVPSGGVYLDADKKEDGYPYSLYSFYISPGQKKPKVLVLPGELTPDVVIQMGARTAYLKLEITDEHGNPIEGGAQLRFTRPDVPKYFERGASAETLMPVPPVPFRLTIEADGYQPWHYVSENRADGDLITAKSGETFSLVVRLIAKQ